MNFKLLAKISVLAFFTVMVSSCGSEGPMGPEGMPGLNGLDGTNGKDGNATVYSSPWYTPNWQGASKDWYFDVTSASISKSVVEGGIILAYASLPNDVYKAAVRPMPCYVDGSNWDYLIPDYGKIEFTCDNTIKPGTLGQFRFVVVPAGYNIQGSTLKAKGLKAVSVADLKSMTYSEVCKTLNIAE